MKSTSGPAVLDVEAITKKYKEGKQMPNRDSNDLYNIDFLTQSQQVKLMFVNLKKDRSFKEAVNRKEWSLIDSIVELELFNIGALPEGIEYTEEQRDLLEAFSNEILALAKAEGRA